MQTNHSRTMPRIMACAAIAMICTYPATAPAQTPYFNDWPICKGGKRVTCVVDGDTFWLDRTKYRIAGIDAPESGNRARCSKESLKADEATLYLKSLLQSGITGMTTQGADRYGRTLAEIQTVAGNISDEMVQTGLAVPYGNKKLTLKWCK